MLYICAVFAKSLRSDREKICLFLPKTKIIGLKRIILLLIGIMTSFPLWAEEEPIILYEPNSSEIGQAQGPIDSRSLSFAPEASHDGNTVYIYSSIPSEGIQITVLDEVGNVVYENEVVGSYVFTLSGSIAGELTLVLETKEGIYQGNFNVE